MKINLSKLLLFSGLIFGLGAVFGGFVSLFVFIRITGGTGEPSVLISAPTLSIHSKTIPIPTEIAQLSEPVNPTATPIPIEIVPTSPATVAHGILKVPTSTIRSSIVDSEGQTADISATQPSPIPTSTIRSIVTDTIATPKTTSELQLFRIVSEESQVSFAVEETLPLGTAIGHTNQIAGDMIVDFKTPTNSELGTIRMNLRTLQTDRLDRDYSIRCCVLLTAQDAYEFSDFVPTGIAGLPERQVSIGETILLQVTGDLNLRGITQSITFDVSLTVVSQTELTGEASATINRSDFEILNNPENRFTKHGVAETVILAFDFVARRID